MRACTSLVAGCIGAGAAIAFAVVGCESQDAPPFDGDSAAGDASLASQRADVDAANADDASNAPEASGTRDASARPPPQVPWSTPVHVAMSEMGVSDDILVPFPASTRYVALRAGPVAGAPLFPTVCFRFEPIELTNQIRIAPSPDNYTGAPCATCTEVLGLGYGGALAVLPTTNLAPLVGPNALHAQVVARDCALGTRVSRAGSPSVPTVLDVAWAMEVAPDAGASAAVDVRVASFADAAIGADLWSTVVATAETRFGEVGIDLSIETVAPLARTGQLDLKVAGSALSDDVAGEALAAVTTGPTDRRFVLMVLVPCIALADENGGISYPFGLTTRVPGATDLSPSISFVRTGRCTNGGPVAPWDTETGGDVLAHEIGHALGLFHADSPSGIAQTHDEDAGQLMNTYVVDTPASVRHFSAEEAEIMKRQPTVSYGTATSVP